MTAQGTLIEDPQGNRFRLVGAQWVPAGSAAQAQRADQANILAQDMGALGAFGMGAARMAGSGYWGPSASGSTPEQYAADMAAMHQQSPWASGLGTAAAAVPGVILAGASIPAQIAMGAAQGAITESDNPMMGAGVGALFGGVGAAIPGAAQAVASGARRFMPAVMEGAENFASTISAGRPRMASIADRVGARISGASPEAGAAGAGGVRPPLTPAEIGALGPGNAADNVLPGLSPKAELDEFGIMLNPGQELGLRPASYGVAARAGELMTQEEALAKSSFVGGPISRAYESQRLGMTNAAKMEAGDLSPHLPTDTMIGNGLKRTGQEMERLYQAAGPVPISADHLRAFNEISSSVTGSGAPESLVNSALRDIQASMDRGGGIISTDDFLRIDRMLNRDIKANVNREGLEARAKVGEDMQNVLRDALYDVMPRNGRQALTQARYQNRIYQTLAKPNVVGKDFQINPVSFNTRWNQGIPKSMRSVDRLGRVSETLAYLQTGRATAGTTLVRNWNPAQIPAAIESGLGPGAVAAGLLGAGNYFLGGN